MAVRSRKIKFYKVILLGLLIFFVGIQFFPAEKNVSSIPAGKAFVDSLHVDKQINIILENACYDCHSNNTRYPWYSNIQPMGWFMANHIKNGKAKLNFDEIPQYGHRRISTKFDQIINQVDLEKMPLMSYKLIHTDSRLTDKDRKLLIEYFKSLSHD